MPATARKKPRRPRRPGAPSRSPVREPRAGSAAPHPIHVALAEMMAIRAVAARRAETAAMPR
jgi:hypothetical protein